MSQTALCVSAHNITPSRILSLTFMQHAQPDMPWSRPPDGRPRACRPRAGPESPSPRHAACVDKTRYMKTVYAVAVTATALTRCSERVHLCLNSHCTTFRVSLSRQTHL